MIFVFKSHLTKQNLNSELLELNLIKTIFANVREFRYEDTVLKEIYGYFESTYHFDFF